MPSDMQKALNLVLTAQATDKVIASGNLSSKSVWASGQAGGNGGKLWVPSGFTLNLDIQTPRLVWLFNQGAFTVQTDTATAINVETIVTDMGSTWTAGTQAAPIIGSHQVVFLDSGPIDTAVYDPFMLSRAFIAMGALTLKGSAADAYAFTTGNKANDTVVKLLTPVVGLKTGDSLLYPGFSAKPGVNDDDLCIAANVSADGLTVTLASPLINDHSIIKRFNAAGTQVGQTIPVLINLSPCSVDFTSENTVLLRRGHIMVMTPTGALASPGMGVDIECVSFHGLGRTDKSKVVTDPDGAGGGLANPRGRYDYIHFHKCGPGPAGSPQAMVNKCRGNGGPGWGFVNHDSNVYIDSTAGVGNYGAVFVGEIGTETGCWCDDIAARPTAPSGDVFTDARSNADWFHGGHGFANMAGGIVFKGKNITYGSPNIPAVIYGVDFGPNTAGVGNASGQVTFASANLPNPPPAGVVVPAQIKPAYVPQIYEGPISFGSRLGPEVSINENPSPIPPVAQSVISDLYYECWDDGFQMRYMSCLDIVNAVGVGLQPNYGAGTGILHPGVSANLNVRGGSMTGFQCAVMGVTGYSQEITGLTWDCLLLARYLNPHYYTRNANVHGNTQVVISAAALAAIPVTPYTYADFQLCGKKQLSVMMRMDLGGDSLYGTSAFWNWTSYYQLINPNDSVVLDGTNVYFPEQGRDFAFSLVPAPAPVASLTTGQFTDQYGESIGGRILPSDAAHDSRVFGMVSANPAVTLPKLLVNDQQPSGYNAPNYQQTNQTTFNVLVKDSTNAWQYWGPYTLNDKAWNLCTIPSIDGYKRSVWVYCDSTQTYPANWGSPPNPLPTLQNPGGAPPPPPPPAPVAMMTQTKYKMTTNADNTVTFS